MAQCPVSGCTKRIGGYAAKSQAKYAAQLEPFIDMIRRLAQIWDTPVAQNEFGQVEGRWSTQDLVEIANDGDAIKEAIHAGAHGAFVQTPTVEVWRG